MGNKRTLRIQNRTSKPINVVNKEHEIIEKCLQIEKELPSFMKDYFIYRKNSVAPSSRLEGLKDIRFFCKYLVQEQQITKAKEIKDITLEEFSKIQARDVNLFLGEYCSRYEKETTKEKVIQVNGNRSLSRKKASLSTLFKFLYRNEQLENNITNGFNPIKLPKLQTAAIKRWEIDEVAIMLEAVETGEGLTDKEKIYWEKTKLRDKAILALFVTYGLRLSELRELNISSFNFPRGEFKIYRKKGKETIMPINKTCELVVRDYILNERPQSEMLSDENKDALFISLKKNRIDVKAIRKLVKKYTSIPMGTTRENGYSPHKLRATAATSMIQNGFSIYDVQNLLDHDNVTTTQLYAAHKKNVKREIVNNFEWLDKKSE